MMDKSQDLPRRIAIIGAGLLGGSVIRSLRRRLPDLHATGFARSDSKRDAILESGLFDAAHPSVEATVADCDHVLVATPVDRIAEFVCEAARHMADGGLITDVGSTKAGIVRAVADDPLAAAKFVAAHPIAGSEKTGLTHSQETLFDGKLVVLTPDQRTDGELLIRAERFWQLVGGRTIRMSPGDHDAHLAAVSHVPHLMSAVVASQTRCQSRPLVGSGWRDITRVASGDPTMWTAICRENRDAILQELRRAQGSIAELIAIIDAGDDARLHDWLTRAKASRDATLGQGDDCQ